jgi:hypothetical protein
LGSLITANSELLSYSVPLNIKKFRSEAALLVKSWKEYDQELMQEHERDTPSYENETSDIAEGEIKALTIEMKSGNIIVRAVQPCLLLVLVGCNDIPHELGDPKNQFHAEAKGDPRYPPLHNNPNQVVFKGPKSLSAEEPHGEASGNEGAEDDGRMVHSELQQSQVENGNEGHTSHPGTGTHSPQNASESPRDDESSTEDSEQAIAIMSLQRSKLDSMVNWLRKQLSDRNFVFREDVP